jgi:hypothetical protein
MDDRVFKRVIIFIVFFIGVILFGLGAYFLLQPEPSCDDGILNQGEKEIDCGGPCGLCAENPVLSPIEVLSAEVVYDTGERYDAAIMIKNPNNLYGLSRLNYQIIFWGQNDSVLAKTSLDSTFILPAEKKYILAQGVQLTEAPQKVTIEFASDLDWKKFLDYEEPHLMINNKYFEVLTGGSASYAQAKGTLINNSSYDFETIRVKVILRDAAGVLLATNAQVMNTVRSGEQRDFIMSFPHSFPGTVTEFEVEPEVNVFDSENYIKVKGSPEPAYNANERRFNY